MYNVIIIGSGPAAHSAGTYCSRNNLKPLILVGENPGGQLLTTTDIENYPGIKKIGGYELVNEMKEQAESWGSLIIEQEVINISRNSSDTSSGESKSSEYQFLVITKENKYACKAIIIATGASPNKLNVTGAEEFWKKGISSCAVCDGSCPVFKSKVIVVVGSGDSSMESATFLSKYASKVIIVHRRDTLRASKVMQQRVLANDKIKFILNSEIIEIKGSEKWMSSVKLRDTITKEIQELECSGLFYAIGHIPNSSFIMNSDLNKTSSIKIQVDKEGYILTDKDNHMTTQTHIKGIFVAGDVHDNRYRQAVTAAASGCMSSIDLAHYLDFC